MEKTLLKECTQVVREETSSAVDTLKNLNVRKIISHIIKKRPHSNDKNNKLNFLQLYSELSFN